MKFNHLLPSDWSAGISAFYEIRKIAILADRKLQVVIGFLLPFSIGAAPSSLILFFSDHKYASDFLSGLLGVMSAVAALIAGFVVSIMLSLGNYKIPSEITYEQHDSFVLKLKYMLYSQVVTLLGAIISMAMSGLAYVVYGAGLQWISSGVLVIIASGYGAFMIFRFSLLPLQIYELNESYFDETLDGKADEVGSKVKSAKNEIISNRTGKS